MILQNKQKKQRLATLDEKTSPFKDSKTRTIFKNTANLSLRGTTYDAKHMDRFLGTTFCLTHAPNTNSHNLGSVTTKRSHPSSQQQTNQQTVRPSVAFASSPRDKVPLQLTYVDLQDGPSSLQVREGEATLLERGKMENFYE